jgi:hypothetical protein
MAADPKQQQNREAVRECRRSRRHAPQQSTGSDQQDAIAGVGDAGDRQAGQ